MLVILELFPIKSELITVNPVFQELQSKYFCLFIYLTTPVRSRILLLLIALPALEILLPMNMDKFLAFLVEILLLCKFEFIVHTHFTVRSADKAQCNFNCSNLVITPDSG